MVNENFKYTKKTSRKAKEFFLGYIFPAVPLIAMETSAVLFPLIDYHNHPENYSNLMQPQPDLTIFFGMCAMGVLGFALGGLLYVNDKFSEYRENYRKTKDSERESRSSLEDKFRK